MSNWTPPGYNGQNNGQPPQGQPPQGQPPQGGYGGAPPQGPPPGGPPQGQYGAPPQGQPPQGGYGGGPPQGGYGGPPQGQYGGGPPAGQPAPYGQPPQGAPQQGQYGGGAPQGQYGGGAPQGQYGGGAPQGQYGGGAPQGQYGGAPAGGYGAPQAAVGGPINFQANVRSLEDNDADLPQGSHIVVGTGHGGAAGQGKLFTIELKVEKSNNPEAIGQTGAHKVWLDRGKMRGGVTAHNEAASKDFAKFVVPASGRNLKDTDLVTATNLVNEFANRMTVEGRPLNQVRLGVDVKYERNPKYNPNVPDSGREYFVRSVFHVLPAGV